MFFKLERKSKYNNVVIVNDGVMEYYFKFNFASKKDYENWHNLIKLLLQNNFKQIDD